MRTNGLLLFVLLNVCTSCTLMMGLKKPILLSEEKIIAQAKEYNIPIADCYTLDTTYYRFLSNFTDTALSTAKNTHAQPLQVLYFKKINQWQLVSYHANCYAGGFPNLNWNRNGTFETFVPQQQAPLDSLMNLKDHFNFMKPVEGTVAFNLINYDYIVLVYWSRYMGKQSKRLIELVQKNLTLSKGSNAKIIYINNDNFFLHAGK